MPIQQVFGPVLDSRITLSPDDRVVAAVVLRHDINGHFDPGAYIRIAWLIGTAPEEATAERVLTAFTDDVEVLASVCMSLVRHLGTRWDGRLDSLGDALAASVRGRTAHTVLAERITEGLRSIDPKTWSLTNGGVDLLDFVNDPQVLADLIGRSSRPAGVIRRLAELGEVQMMLSLVRAASGSLSGRDWTWAARPLEPATRKAFLLELIGRVRASAYLLQEVQTELEALERTQAV